MSAIDDLTNKSNWHIDRVLQGGLPILEYLPDLSWGDIEEAAAEYAEMQEKIKQKDKELWAINDELVKAGLKPIEYETFALCVAALRARITDLEEQAEVYKGAREVIDELRAENERINDLASDMADAIAAGVSPTEYMQNYYAWLREREKWSKE